jgi:hypothetical protein
MGATKHSLENIEWDLHEQPQEEPKDFTEENNVELFGIEPVKAKEMVSGLSTTLAERQVLKDAYIDVIELNITTENRPTFKELRLKIMKNRTQGLTKWKEKEKAFYLAGGNFIQAIYNKEVAVNEEMESKLLEAELYFVNMEKARLDTLRVEREAFLRPFVDVVPNGLEDLDQDVFDSFLETKKKAHLEKLELERLEVERIENERLEREKEIEAQRVENERLKAEAEAKDKALEKERAENELKAKQERDKAEAERKAESDKQAKIQAEKDAEIKKEREAKEVLEAEIKAKKDAEIKAEADKKAESDKLAKAGKKVQLDTWIETFNIEIPVHLKYDTIANDILSKFWQFKTWAKKQGE